MQIGLAIVENKLDETYGDGLGGLARAGAEALDLLDDVHALAEKKDKTE